MAMIPDGSVQLVVTSPPYPMVEMWDGLFADMDPDVGVMLSQGDGLEAFEAMHAQLDKVWSECVRVLAEGGFVAINVGDATRTVGANFRLFHNHARIVSRLAELGMTVLPDILWRKPTNAPNKFMGSGMLPAGAYVTYEHEYILLFRKGGKRVFSTAADKENRAHSAYFWEERNVWFSDVWTDLRGISQDMKDAGVRTRSAAYPLALPYRIIQMYSVYGDTILDPFVGTGTTQLAAASSGRNSIGVDICPALGAEVRAAVERAQQVGDATVLARLDAHRHFVDQRVASGKTLKHASVPYGFPVVTRQEKKMVLLKPSLVTTAEDGSITVIHS